MEKNDIKVTILVPIYNVEKYIEKCLISLINQTYENIEIWAVIDGSPDNSIEVVKAYAKKDKRIKCIEKENGGYGSVLEYGVTNITSKYFLICDPDDWLELNAIEILVKKAEKYNLDILVGDKNIIYENDIVGYEKLNDKYYLLESGKVYYGKEAKKFAFMHPSPHAKLYRTEITRQINFPHKVSYTDFILYQIALEQSKSVMYIEDRLSYYLVDRIGNTRKDKSEKAIRDHLIVWNSVYEQTTMANKFIIYRLYMELKVIMSIYYNNSLVLFKDEFYDMLKDNINNLRAYKTDIEKNFTMSNREKLECKMIFGKEIFLKIYIILRKILKR